MAAVLAGLDFLESGLVDRAEVDAVREVPAQQAVGVLIAAALPGAVRVAEVDLRAGIDGEVSVLAHLLALIPGQRAAQALG